MNILVTVNPLSPPSYVSSSQTIIPIIQKNDQDSTKNSDEELKGAEAAGGEIETQPETETLISTKDKGKGVAKEDQSEDGEGGDGAENQGTVNFNVPKGLLIHNSRYFQKMLSGEWTESKSHSVSSFDSLPAPKLKLDMLTRSMSLLSVKIQSCLAFS